MNHRFHTFFSIENINFSINSVWPGVGYFVKKLHKLLSWRTVKNDFLRRTNLKKCSSVLVIFMKKCRLQTALKFKSSESFVLTLFALKCLARQHLLSN